MTPVPISFPIRIEAIHWMTWTIALVGPAIEVIIFLYDFDGRNLRFNLTGQLGLMASTYPDWTDQIRRLLTYSLIHGGPIHAAMNALTILIFADVVAIYWGFLICGLIMVFSGISGGIAFLIFADNGMLIGSSAIAYGLIGASLIAVLCLSPLHWLALAIISIMAFSTFYIGELSTLSWLAHISGFSAGFIAGFIATPRKRDSTT